MRLYLLPVSTRRTLLYCKRAVPDVAERETLMDKIQSKAARTWAGWEKKERGWQRRVVEYGNYAFRRIPYEEWGLKSVPPLTKARREEAESAAAAAGAGAGDKAAPPPKKVEVVYPRTLIRPDRVPEILHALSTERESLHRRRLIWCFVGMPITAPIALLPVIPNIPFFYLVYRAWSHWRALAGGRHIQFLLQHNLLAPTPSPVLDQVYADQEHPLPSTPEPTTEQPSGGSPAPPKIDHPNPEAAAELHPHGEALLLSQENGRRMTEALDLPQLEVELERAIWQVETAIRRQNGEKPAAAADAADGDAPSKHSSPGSPVPSDSEKSVPPSVPEESGRKSSDKRS